MEYIGNVLNQYGISADLYNVFGGVLNLPRFNWIIPYSFKEFPFRRSNVSYGEEYLLQSKDNPSSAFLL